MQPSFKGNWYPGLDGVRAIAVLMVFLVHTVPTLILSVGWAGVQVFFVLSGFLITGILFDNRDKPNRWRNFYARRTLRIFPLFFFVWIVIGILTPIVHLQWHPVQALWPMYLGNYIRFFVGSPAMDVFYIPALHHPMEVAHFWSLAVEEQFYVLWPLVVFSVGDRLKLARVCQVGIAAVLLLRIALLYLASPNLLHMALLYRLTITQADGFMIGGLMALWMRGPERDRLLRWSLPLMVLPLVAFAVIKLSYWHREHAAITTTSPWTSTWGFTLLDLASAGMILLAMTPGTFVFRICTTRFLRRLGLYSYGFYVYHRLLLTSALIPVRAGLRRFVHVGHLPGDALYFAVAFVLIFAVSAASYHLVEMPFLKLKGLFTEAHRNPELVVAPTSEVVA